MMSLIKAYEERISVSDISDDPAQRTVILQMQRVAEELATSTSSWRNLWRKKPVHGLYLYGPVGVGKTYLGDLFYEYVPEKRKARFHFHQFMQQVDAQLRQLQGQKDPLKRIAAKVAESTRLLCFDEFMVYDVAHAMILAKLLQELFEHDVVLVATSNTKPDDLYPNGPQRERFLPAIELIKQHCYVDSIVQHADYRLGRAPKEQAYLCPLNEASEQALQRQFASVAGSIQEGGELTIQHRAIPFVMCTERAVWFQFDVICNLPRSQLDYLELADRFDRIIVSNIPKLSADDTMKVILLINFIDVMYDRGIRLVISAAVPLNELYVEGEMLSSFQRTLSRLEEMQSEDYARRHQRREGISF